MERRKEGGNWDGRPGNGGENDWWGEQNIKQETRELISDIPVLTQEGRRMSWETDQTKEGGRKKAEEETSLIISVVCVSQRKKIEPYFYIQLLFPAW